MGFAAADRLRALMAEGAGTSPVLAPGVWDGLSARLAVQAGASALHASGGAIARAAGQPDLGIIGLAEMEARIGEIVEGAGKVPVIADADTGYGGLLNLAHAVRRYARLGVAALHVEDQPFPKRCGLFDGVTVVPQADMVARLRAARDTVSGMGGGPLIIARTDAIKPEGLDAALGRMRAYIAAGADMAFVEGLEDVRALEAAQAALPGVPQLFNASMSATGLPVPPARLAALGIAVVIYPGDAQRAAVAAMDATFRTMLRDADTRAVSDRLASPALRDGAVGTRALMEAEARWIEGRG
ncbi:oxaloacetate decarboxylase [Roseomonas sp. AR75]|uniref:isocitrate lyase/PEP mutase family protein n=1 Tax=Roseomonas sp. AR75 TaxID=2562311 RepID=UPI0010C0148F|nr:isocitrate lyase/PEP mutase family protein [Roseomonas sp. AR75]